jgi:VIT1/CCC1 family predicted Fe2+/Mn2+ transporter
MSKDFRASISDETMNQIHIAKGLTGVSENGEIVEELLKVVKLVRESDELELEDRPDDIVLME